MSKLRQGEAYHDQKKSGNPHKAMAYFIGIINDKKHPDHGKAEYAIKHKYMGGYKAAKVLLDQNDFIYDIPDPKKYP